MSKSLLFIGSTVADIIIKVDKLPRSAEDVNIDSQVPSLGGCAYNAYHAASLFDTPATLFSPIGTGIYGDFVRKCLNERGVKSAIPDVDSPNGCCYCFIEPSGERTFICNQAAEYIFEKKWFDAIDVDTLSGVYVCGLEIHKKKTAGNIIAFLESIKDRNDIPIYFAPSPHICAIEDALMERILACHPILHVNAKEAVTYAGKLGLIHTGSTNETDSKSFAGFHMHAEAAAKALGTVTGNTVIVTLGPDGALFCEGGICKMIPGVKANQINATGAGDSHIGSIMACRAMGCSFEEAIEKANRVAAAVVECEDAQIATLPFCY